MASEKKHYVTQQPIPKPLADAFGEEGIWKMATAISESSKGKSKMIPLAVFVKELNRIARPVWVYERRHFLIYNRKRGHYVNGEILVDKLLMLIFNNMSSHARKENFLMLEREFMESSADFDAAREGLLGCKNGVLDLKTFEFRPHDPKNRLVNAIAATYNPKADCPQFKRFLSQVVSPSDAKTLQEWLGFVLTGGYRFQTALILQGEGSNGKGTFLLVLSAMISEENVSAVSLQNLSHSRFAAAELFNKMANVYADLPDEALRQTDTFKMLTGGDNIPAEQKFKNPFKFKNSAKLLFSANKLPETTDLSDAFFRRWCIVKFPYQFMRKDADRDLLAKLTAETELSGVLNFALEGLKRLLVQGEFTNATDVSRVRLVYLKLSDSVAAFAQECVVADPDAPACQKQIWLNNYLAYCRANNLPPVTGMKFFQRLPELVLVSESQLTMGSERPRCWLGIRFKPFMTADPVAQDAQGSDPFNYTPQDDENSSKDSENAVQGVHGQPEGAHG